MAAVTLRVQYARVAIASVIAALILLMAASSAWATHGPNVFSGQWTTTLYDGSAGSVTFKVVTDAVGASGVESLGGHACGAPTTYYRGDYSDSANPHGVIYGCIATAGHLVGRFKSDTTGTDAGGLDVIFAAPNTFSGHFTYQGSDYAYSGVFASHTPDDGCCPQPTGGGTTGGGACAARARIALASAKPPCPPKPPVSAAEKDSASDKNNRNLALMVVFCLFADPDEKSDICSFVIDMASFVGQIQNDPPSRDFARVHVAQAPRINASLRLFCPRGCPRAAGAVRGFAQALAQVDAALAGLATAGNRYSGARLVGSTAGQLLQAGVAQAYAGVLADALAALTGRATALANALGRAGVTTTLTSVQISQGLTLLQNGLPAPYARRLPAGGESATALAKSVTSAVGQPAGPVSFAQALQVGPPPAAFRAANRTITVAELGAVVDQLGSQRAISKRARTLLHNDLNAITRAANQAAHGRALSRLRRDIGGLPRSVRAASKTLLQHAAAGLG